VPQWHLDNGFQLVHSELVAYAGHLRSSIHSTGLYHRNILLPVLCAMVSPILHIQSIARFYFLYDGSFHAVSHSVSKYEAKTRKIPFPVASARNDSAVLSWSLM
jgi:hypothetical protein